MKKLKPSVLITMHCQGVGGCQCEHKVQDPFAHFILLQKDCIHQLYLNNECAAHSEPAEHVAPGYCETESTSQGTA